MTSTKIIEIWSSSPAIMTVLFTSSVLLVATALERWWCYRGIGYADEALWKRVENALQRKDFAAAMQEIRGDALFAQALRESIELYRASPAARREDVEDLWMLRRDEAAEVLRKQLSVFSTLSFITPLLGLMGSVLGIHHSFHSIALTGIGGPSVIAAGVSEALLCTLVGVSVAVPSLVLNNVFFSGMIGRLSSWDRVGQELGRAASYFAKAGAAASR